MVSVKSILAYSTLLVLDFHIECLLLLAHCLNFILHYLKDDPPVDHVATVPLVEITAADKDGTSYKDGTDNVEEVPTATTGDPPTRPFSQAEAQTHPPSSKSPQLLPISPDHIITMPLNAQRTDSNMPPPSAPSRLTGIASGSNNRREEDELRLIVPCWDHEDVIGEGSTCPVMMNPGLVASSYVRTKVGLRAQELLDKFDSDSNPSSLERSNHIVDHVLAVSHPSVELLGYLLLGQAIIRSTLFGRTHDISVLDKAIDGYQAGLSLVPRNDTARHERLREMGDLARQRHDLKMRREDLNLAIEAYREALASWPQGGNPPLALIHNLTAVLIERYAIWGDVSGMESAFHYLDQLLSIVGENHPLRPGILQNLGLAFHTRSKRTGSTEDVEHAIRHLQQALSLEADNSPNRPKILSILANSFYTRYKMLGGVSDLDEAVRSYQMTLYITNSDTGTLNNLANILLTRFERTGDATDLGQAILHLEKAISILSDDDPRRPAYLGNLATMLDTRHDTTKNIADLHKSIYLYEQFLSLQPDDHPHRPWILNNLCTALHKRFFASGNMADKTRGVDCLAKALSLIPSDHPDRQTILYNFLRIRYTLAPWDTLSTEDLALVLRHCAELALTPQHHAEYSKRTILVATALLACHKRGLDTSRVLLVIGLDSQSSAEDAAFTLLERSAKAFASPSIYQLDAACKQIQLRHELNRPWTLDMFTRMFDFLDVSIARGCSLETRHEQISTHPYIRPAKQLVSEAVAFAISQDKIGTAVEFLERGQSILLAQLSRYRSSSLLEALHAIRPDLVRRFRDLSWQVEHATFTEGRNSAGINPQRPLEDPISRSNRFKAEWEAVVQEIRTLDGFHHFLRPPPFPVLQQAATQGPVVLVNISESRSDAIIVTSDRQPFVVPLPFATPEQVGRLSSTFKAAPQSMSNRKAYDGLKAIWDTIVEAVVTELQDTLELPKGSRIWWCPTNSAISLPLHAAGLYQLKGDQCSITKNCLPFLYISSYTPTLGALVHAREGRDHNPDRPSVLLVGQPNTPGQNEIPEVREEIRLIKKRVPGAREIMGEDGTHDAVLSGVEQHEWVHLACHGHVHSTNPLQSRFVLHDRPLALLEIMQQRLPTAEFAFLSACHSASGDSTTPDEFLHLAAGMQFAGFRSVVGTMWAMADFAGPPLADEFYRKMFPKKGKVDHTMAAQALYGATKKLWKDGVPLAVWINFVHWGA